MCVLYGMMIFYNFNRIYDSHCIITIIIFNLDLISYFQCYSLKRPRTGLIMKQLKFSLYIYISFLDTISHMNKFWSAKVHEAKTWTVKVNQKILDRKSKLIHYLG